MFSDPVTPLVIIYPSFQNRLLICPLPEGPAPPWTPKQVEIMEEIKRTRPGTGISGPFGPWLASPEVAMEAQGLGRAVRYGTSFDMKESELVILLTAAWTGSKAEFDIHSAEAIKAGLPPSCVSLIWSSMSSVASGRWDPSFIPALCSSVGDDGLSLLARFTCLLLEGKGEVEDEVYKGAVDGMGERKVIECVCITGYYTMVAYTLKCFRVKPGKSNLDELGLK